TRFSSARSVAWHHAGNDPQPTGAAAWLERDGPAHSHPVFSVQSFRQIQPDVPAENAVGAGEGGGLVHWRTGTAETARTSLNRFRATAAYSEPTFRLPGGGNCSSTE